MVMHLHNNISIYSLHNMSIGLVKWVDGWVDRQTSLTAVYKCA